MNYLITEITGITIILDLINNLINENDESVQKFY